MLYWRTSQLLREAYDSSIQVRSIETKSTEVWGGGSRPMGDWMFPTTQWKPGQIISDEFVLKTPKNQKGGKYNFLVD